MSDKKIEVFFDKAVFGGYDTTQVDEFVEEARKLLSSQKKENEVLKQKLTILADKIEEYRAAENADAKPAVVEPARADVRADSPEALEKTLQMLKDQIREAEATLEVLVQEKAALTASMARQYEQCLRVMREDAMVEIPEKPAEIAAEPSVPAPEPVTEPKPEPVPISVVETIAAVISEPQREPEPVVVPEAVIEPEPEPVASEPEPEPEPEPIPSIAETVEAGESVYLNTDSDEMASLSYEEALTMVLKKNGILRTVPSAKSQQETAVKTEPVVRAESAVQKEDLQTTKIIPRVQAAGPVPVAEKPQKKKEGHSFFGGIRKSIHNFLEDEADDDAKFDKTSELKFGKGYNVNNDQ